MEQGEKCYYNVAKAQPNLPIYRVIYDKTSWICWRQDALLWIHYPMQGVIDLDWKHRNVDHIVYWLFEVRFDGPSSHLKLDEFKADHDSRYYQAWSVAQVVHCELSSSQMAVIHEYLQQKWNHVEQEIEHSERHQEHPGLSKMGIHDLGEASMKSNWMSKLLVNF